MLSKKNKKELESILTKLIRAQTYILLPDTYVCKETAMMSNDVFQDIMGNKYIPINKEIGSELALLHTGINQLKQILYSK